LGRGEPGAQGPAAAHDRRCHAAQGPRPPRARGGARARRAARGRRAAQGASHGGGVMIVRDIEAPRGAARDGRAPNWGSVRMLLRSDGMGFSLHETTIYPGTETYIHYANRLEAVYCIEGEGEVETLDDGKVHAIRPGIMYALDKHDRHYLRAKTR